VQKDGGRDLSVPLRLHVRSANRIGTLTWKKGRWLVVALIAGALGTAFLAACGGSNSGSDQFRDKTDSPLLDFGDEGNTAELEEATEAVGDFFKARSQGDWEEACAQLSRAILAKIEHLATSATDLADKSCPSFLGTFTSLTDQERRESMIVEPGGGLRQQGDHAFLIYYGGQEVVYAMPLSREGGAWKLASLSSKALS
jgi:hypothetical protein